MPQTVLVVDDEMKIVELVANYLKNDGFSVIKAANRKEALALFQANGPDCLLLDINVS